LLEKGYIRPSSPPWGAPIILVSKKDGTQQMWVYCRALNEVTTENNYLLPRIDSLFDQLRGASVCSLKSTFDWDSTKMCDLPKSAFILRNGPYK
jgi:hypothetical protein